MLKYQHNIKLRLQIDAVMDQTLHVDLLYINFNNCGL